MNIVKKEYDYRKQSLLSDKQFNEHLKLYDGYVNRSNDYMEKLNRATKLISLERLNSNEYTLIKSKETFDLDGVILHDLFFENLTWKANISAWDVDYNIFNVIQQNFAYINNWTTDFKECAKIAKGWVIFGYEPFTQTYRNIILNTHNDGLISGFKPIIVLDMYEHAYWMDYGADKNKYIDSFIESINWSVAESRINSF